MTQPNPIQNNNIPIVEQVVQELGNFHNQREMVELFLDRKELGLQRYGIFLQAHNGRDALVDALEEALDKSLYLKQALEEGSEHQHHIWKMYRKELSDISELLTIIKCPCHDRSK